MDDKLLRARQLYEALTERSSQRDDRALARSPEYREFLALGIALCQDMGAAGFDRLTEQFYGPEDPRSASAAAVLRHWWAGLSQLYGHPEDAQAKGGKPLSAKQDYVILTLAKRATVRRRSPKSGPGLTAGQAHPIKLQ